MTVAVIAGHKEEAGVNMGRKHEVQAEIKNIELVRAKSSLRLRLWAEGKKIGELEVGQGSLYWWGKNRRKSKRLDWSRFAEKMNELAYE